MIRYILLYISIFTTFLFGSTSLDQLQDSQSRLEQSLWFSKGVLELKNKNYQEAIYLFNKTKKFIKFPSLLNIAIVQYNQNKIKTSKGLFLKLINDQVIEDDLYVYMSANIYLYKITKDKNYLQNIIKQSAYAFDASDRERRILIDTYIQLNDFKKAEMIIDKNNNIDKFKKGILALINDNLFEAKQYLQDVLEATYDKDKKLDIYWFILYIDLKLGNMDRLATDVEHLKQYNDKYFPNDIYRLVLDVDMDKYDSNYYLNKIEKLDTDTKIDLTFYFTSYLFGDDVQTQYAITDSFFLLKKEMLNNLEKMTAYNKLLLKYVQGDPYILREKLKNFKHKDKKSYMYFNLGLAYAKIGEYRSALEQFIIASNLKPGNKLYALYALLCAKQTNKTFKGQKQLQEAILKGINDEAIKAKLLYKLLIKNSKASKDDLYGIDEDRLSGYISYIGCSNDDCSKLSFFDDTTDVVKNILYLNANRSTSEFLTISNIQDNLKKPKDLEKTLPVVQKLYSNYMKAVGLGYKLNNNSVNYVDSFAKKVQQYDIQSKDGLYVLAASSILNNRYDEDAYITIALADTIYKDNDSSFLIGLRYLKSKDFDKALERFNAPFSHEYIDFKLEGLKDLIGGL